MDHLKGNFFTNPLFFKVSGQCTVTLIDSSSILEGTLKKGQAWLNGNEVKGTM